MRKRTRTFAGCRPDDWQYYKAGHRKDSWIEIDEEGGRAAVVDGACIFLTGPASRAGRAAPCMRGR
jgi:hypothetical protein